MDDEQVRISMKSYCTKFRHGAKPSIEKDTILMAILELSEDESSGKSSIGALKT